MGIETLTPIQRGECGFGDWISFSTLCRRIADRGTEQEARAALRSIYQAVGHTQHCEPMQGECDEVYKRAYGMFAKKVVAEHYQTLYESLKEVVKDLIG